jgi:hypothetical protein
MRCGALDVLPGVLPAPASTQPGVSAAPGQAQHPAAATYAHAEVLARTSQAGSPGLDTLYWVFASLYMILVRAAGRRRRHAEPEIGDHLLSRSTAAPPRGAWAFNPVAGHDHAAQLDYRHHQRQLRAHLSKRGELSPSSCAWLGRRSLVVLADGRRVRKRVHRLLYSQLPRRSPAHQQSVWVRPGVPHIAAANHSSRPKGPGKGGLAGVNTLTWLPRSGGPSQSFESLRNKLTLIVEAESVLPNFIIKQILSSLCKVGPSPPRVRGGLWRVYLPRLPIPAMSPKRRASAVGSHIGPAPAPRSQPRQASQ